MPSSNSDTAAPRLPLGSFAGIVPRRRNRGNDLACSKNVSAPAQTQRAEYRPVGEHGCQLFAWMVYALVSSNGTWLLWSVSSGTNLARVETVRESARRKVFRDHFLARVNPQLRKDPMKMGMDRGAADTQCIRDLLVQKTCKNARENFFFAFR
jgi:hypothetical protein